MKKLINDVQDVLDEQLAGLAKAHPSLTLHQDPVYVTRADAPVAGKVALLSGGGSGHEPMHCGYIGQGMLSGACPGEIFTSPTPDKIFECSMQIDGGEGVLLIIKNYTGDILNFETATELLHDSGVKVTTVVIDDDVAVKDSLYTAGRRGVANTVLIEKLVGAAAGVSVVFAFRELVDDADGGVDAGLVPLVAGAADLVGVEQVPSRRSFDGNGHAVGLIVAEVVREDVAGADGLGVEVAGLTHCRAPCCKRGRAAYTPRWHRAGCRPSR